MKTISKKINSFLKKIIVMANTNKTKRTRTPKYDFYVVSSTSGIYKAFRDIDLCCQFYAELVSTIPEGVKVKAGHYKWSERDMIQFNLFYDEVFEPSKEA